VSDERIDPETLAAFLEGGLAPAERERVMRALAESPEAYADFTEAAAVARDVDVTANTPLEPATVVPIQAAKARRTSWYVAPILLAAGIAAVVVVKRGAGVGANTGAAIMLAQATHVVPGPSGAVTTTLGESWDQPPWSVARGGESGAGDAARAFRAGARYAEMEVAVRAADSAATTRLAETLARAAESVDAGGPIAAQLRDVRVTTTAADRARVAARLRSVLGASATFDAGVWTETARLSLLSNRLDFFGPENLPMTELRRLIMELEKSPSEASLADALRPIASGRNWSEAGKGELAAAIDAAIAAGAK
jgi:hypothetical protein